jgi:signal transduction histidine kinase
MGVRAERWLQAIGLGIWLFVGAPTLVGFVRRPAEVATPHGAAWLALYLGFAAAFWLSTGSAAPPVRRLWLLGQSAAAFGLLFVGMPKFEGALLAVVAAQTPSLFPWPVAAAWMFAQAVPLFLVIFPSHHLLGSLEAVGAYLAFGGFAMGAAFLRQREVRARLDLARLNAELLGTRRLLADSTRMSERLRISRDLHDTLGHHLIALNLKLEREQQRAGESEGPVTQAKAIVHQMLADVRQVVGGLREDGGLDVGRAILTLAESVPEPRVHFDLPDGLDPVDPERAQAMFRCVQEALTNAVKHGGARNLWVRVVRTDQAFELHLEDDGRGTAQVAFGNGLSGMRDRIADLGGQLAVSSQPGQGFHLRASIPLLPRPA